MNSKIAIERAAPPIAERAPVVDDHESWYQRVKAWLGNWRVDWANPDRNDDLSAMLRDADYLCVFLDLNMRSTNGRELYRCAADEDLNLSTAFCVTTSFPKGKDARWLGASRGLKILPKRAIAKDPDLILQFAGSCVLLSPKSMWALIVEDAQDHLTAYVAAITACGIPEQNIQMAGTYEDARKRLDERRFDVILVDTYFPRAVTDDGTGRLANGLADQTLLGDEDTPAGIELIKQMIDDEMNRGTGGSLIFHFTRWPDRKFLIEEFTGTERVVPLFFRDPNVLQETLAEKIERGLCHVPTD